LLQNFIFQGTLVSQASNRWSNILMMFEAKAVVYANFASSIMVLLQLYDRVCSINSRKSGKLFQWRGTMGSKLRVGGLVILAVFLSQTSKAAPINYDENIGGDLSNNNTTFSLDVGVNTIKGDIHLITNYSPSGAFLGFDTDFDSFLISVPKNTLLTSANVSTSFSDTSGNTGMMNIMWVINGISNPLSSYTDQNIIASTSGMLPPSGGSLWSDTVPIPSYNVIPIPYGTYGVNTPGACGWGGITFDQTYGGYVNYTLSFTVDPVPEPTTMLLLGTGLAGIVAARRKKLNCRQPKKVDKRWTKSVAK
jgi:hypothetical protein